MRDELTVTSHSPIQTRHIGAQLGALLSPGDVVTLTGDLGAGKTTLCAGIAQGWGTTEPVTSPTFVLINRYGRADGSFLFHADAYRLNGVDDAENSGLLDLLDDGDTVLIEWPEQIANALPTARLSVTLAHHSEQARSITIRAHGGRYHQHLTVLATALARGRTRMIIAVDTATPELRIAVMNTVGEVLAEHVYPANRYHTAQLSPAVEATMAALSWPPDVVRAVGVAVGPGSFSGLRTGVAWAKGFALATGCALVGVPTLNILAAAQPPPYKADIRLLCTLAAGRGRIAAGWYDWHDGQWLAAADKGITTWDAIADRLTEPVVICGAVDETAHTALAAATASVYLAVPHRNVRRAAVLAELTDAALGRGELSDPATLAPDYWRQPTETPPAANKD